MIKHFIQICVFLSANSINQIINIGRQIFLLIIALINLTKEHRIILFSALKIFKPSMQPYQAERYYYQEP